MGDNRNFAALEWVAGEIDETLKQAQQALEAYVDNPQDSSRLRFCLTYIHQVHGSLQMVEFFGAALLAEEMETLSQALIDNTIKNTAEAHEVLMRAILQLPIYLEQIKTSRQDNPATLLPLLNDLRASRGAKLLSQSRFFSPDISAAHRTQGRTVPTVANPEQFKVVVSKLRQMYQYAASGVIRGIKTEENFAYLHKAFDRLFQLTQGTARQPLWDIVVGLVELLQADGLELSVAIKELLRQLDREIKVLVVHGPAALKAYSSDELIKNLLFYLSQGDACTDRLRRLHETYGLITNKAEDLESSLMAPDLDTLKAVVAAVNDELGTIKESLEQAMVSVDAESLNDLLDVMKRVADTLAVLGVGDLRRQMLAQVDVLQVHVNDSELDRELLDQIASEIINIERGLQMLTTRQHSIGTSSRPENQLEIDQAQQTVLREARNGLELAKDAIVEYISSQWDRQQLDNVPRFLDEVRGALSIIPLKRAADVLNACSHFVSEQLITQEASPDWASLDTLADAIASVEFYLERLCGDSEEDADLLLIMAEESVVALGYANLVDSPQPQNLQQSATTASAESVLSKIADIEAVDMTILPDQSEPADSLLIAEDAFAQPVMQSVSGEMSTGIDQQFTSGFQSEPLEEQRLTNGLDQPSAIPDEDHTVQIEDSSPSNESQAAVVDVHDDDGVDEEIIEIFIEEAGEVLDTIAEYFPQWMADFENRDALTEFRRAFHTLKGSGRMVGANEIGELAWAVENMLNRIMDGSVQASQHHVNYIEKVRNLVPSMVEAFSLRQANPQSALAHQYQQWGEMLAAGNVPDELHGATNSGQVMDEDDDRNDDFVLWEIFGTEALSHLQVVQDFIAAMELSAPIYTPPSDGMQRALHTLKGSAHMADVTPIAELATPLERFVKELRTYQVNVDDDILQLIRDGVTYTKEALEQIKAGELIVIVKLDQFLARVAELKDRSVGPLIRMREAEGSSEKAVDPKLLSIFMAEEMNLLLDADEILSAWQENPGNNETLRPLMAELSTLALGAEQANLPPMATLSRQLEKIHHALLDGSLSAGPEVNDSLFRGHAALLDMVDGVAAGQNLETLSIDIQAIIDDSLKDITQPPTPQPEAFSGAAEPNMDAGFGAEFTPEFSSSERDLVAQDVNQDESAFISNEDSADGDGVILPGEEAFSSAFSIDLDDTAVSPVMSAEYSESVQQEFEPDSNSNSNSYQDLSADSSDSGYEIEQADTSSLEDINENIGNVDEFSSSHTAESSGMEQVVEEKEELFASVAPFSSQATSVDDSSDSDQEDDEVDDEIVDIFIEEADELLEEVDDAIHRWEDDWGNVASSEALKRILHTLKGGARLAGLKFLGDTAHDFESFIIHADGQDGMDQSFFTQLHTYQDQILTSLEQIKSGVAASQSAPSDSPQDRDKQLLEANTATSLSEEVSNAEFEPVSSEDDLPRSAPSFASAAGKVADVLPFIPKRPSVPDEGAGLFPAAAAGKAVKGPSAPTPLNVKRSAPQEVVKVSADLLEELVNLAGETSISRGQIEEQISDLGFTLEEMDSTIQRLQEQLRRLDIETEAQVLFRQEQLAEDENFDPLEMDRYSQLQQLSRSLIESASDLLDLKVTLADKTRDTETLLLQQSRINTELQEGLMRSRMVPFSRMVPRLRRIVRQVSSELGKLVNFELDNIEGEMDRSILERMVAPLEHMLRNAIDHGIEMPDQRLATGKPETGRVFLSLGREGGDVVLRLVDDGRGINLQRVREKAIESGLMSADAQLSDHDIMQFILHAGFSTAESVSQISGRGVGMDVVHSEIKQIGGSMLIDSRPGEGTSFTIHLPFTVSVNRALMVRMGDDAYAIPLNTIEGIVRVSPFELEHYYMDNTARFEYAGEQYQVRYLGKMLANDQLPRLDAQSMPMPVILVRSGNHAVAMQVDQLMGSREIVVKSLGPQFSAVVGVSGATIMGDGNVVVILDPHAMIRREAALLHESNTTIDLMPEEAKIDKVTTVMVVDDSVTVRKVTSRVLEREGYNVITAKDGVEAMQTLQDHIPDVMLLDIEMPRMDGFELAKNIRISSQWKDIPIIMITSRTGQKHRDHAASLGVNMYMGKPFQEEKLLENIKTLIEADNQEL